jgi:type II secretory pathway component PulC
MDTLSKEEEAKLLLKLYPDVTPEQADTISEIASMTRAEMISESPKLSSAISTRLSVELAGLLSDGFTLEEGAEVAIYPFFDADGGVDSERTYIKQLVQKYIGTAEEDIFNTEEAEAETE